MPHDRFYLQDELQTQELHLSGTEFAHLKVIKPNIGDKIELVNGKGVLAKAIIQKIKSDAAFLEVIKIEKALPSVSKITLLQGIPKKPKIDFIVEKATELGVDEIIFFPGDFSEKKGLDTERCKLLSIAAMKQCGRLFLPKITYSAHPVFAMKDSLLLYGDHAGKPLREVAASGNFPISDINIIIGPEKGLSKIEKENISQRGIAVSFSSNTLRCETAAITAIALLRHLL